MTWTVFEGPGKKMASRREVCAGWIEWMVPGSCTARRETAGTYSLELMLSEDSLLKPAWRERRKKLGDEMMGSCLGWRLAAHDLLSSLDFRRDCPARAVI